MKIGWFGYGGNHWLAEVLRDEIVRMGHSLITCHEYPNANVPYDYKKINQFVDSCDVIILPGREVQNAKGTNRLAISWSRGKACIVFALDSYLQFVESGVNAIVAKDNNEFLNSIKMLEDSNLRHRLGSAGKQSYYRHFRPTELAGRFLEGLTRSKYNFAIIIPHYLERKDYLKAAVDSALASRGPKRTVFVASSSVVSPKEHIDERAVLIESTGKKSFSENNNIVLKQLSDEFTHALLLNDDAILTEDALQRYAEVACDDALINPYSNCDMGWLHNDYMEIEASLNQSDPRIKLVPNMKIEIVDTKELQKIKVPRNPELLNAPFCAFYATLIPMKIIKDVGLLDEDFKNGCEDSDYCERAKAKGYKTYWTKHVYVFHFGGKSRKASEDANHQKHHEEDQLNHQIFKRKHSKKKSLAIWTGPAWEKWDVDTPYTTGIGGSETCASLLAKTAAADGVEVHMYGDHHRKAMHGVELHPWTEFDPKDREWDLFIASRNTNPITADLRAKNRIVWVHDIWLLSGQRVAPEIDARITKYAVLSPWHQQFFTNHHSLSTDRTVIIPNGIDTSLYLSEPDSKQYGKLIYSSSPDRGLDNIIYLLPWIRDQVPEVHVDVFYGFHNWRSAAISRGGEELKRIEILETDLEKVRDSVTFHDRVTQPILASEWKDAYAWFYPTGFSETFCLTAMEARLTSTPILCADYAALTSTVGKHGIRIPGWAYSVESRKRYIDELVKLFKDKNHWRYWSQVANIGARDFDWKNIYQNHWKVYL